MIRGKIIMWWGDDGIGGGKVERKVWRGWGVGWVVWGGIEWGYWVIWFISSDNI